MPSAPWMPWHEQDFARDTLHLSTDARLVYRELLALMWQMPGQLLRVDDTHIARLLRMSVKRWRRVRPEIETFFQRVEQRNGNRTDAFWTSKRLHFERQRAERLIAQRAQAGRLGGLAKSRKRNNPDLATAVADDVANGCYPDPDPDREDDDDEEEEEEERARADFEDPFGQEEPGPVAPAQARDPELDRIRGAAGLKPEHLPPLWQDNSLRTHRDQWRAMNLTMDEIEEVTRGVAASAPGPIRSPRYLDEEMQKAAGRKQAKPFEPIPPAEGERHAKRSDAPKPVDIDAAVLQFSRWGRE